MGRDYENSRCLVCLYPSRIIFLLADGLNSSYRMKIQVFAAESPSYSDDRLIHGIESLSRNLKSICQSETFSQWMTNCSITDDMRELRVLLTSLCHVCHIILHASVVPIFSGRPLNTALTRASTRLSGDIIFSHATEMGRLLQEYLSTGPDLTKLSPLVGFVAFIAGSVLVISAKLRIYKNTNDRIQPPAVDSILIEACLATLGTLRTYWMLLQSPVSLVQRDSLNSSNMSWTRYN